MTVPDRFRGRRTVTVYGLTFALPMVVWQLVFFVFPLLFLVALTFWLVKNYRMEPGFDSVNWVKMYTRGYFWDAYGFTFLVALVSTAVTSLLAFPAAYALAFNVSAAARRWAVFFLIIPFFTSYLVRAYSWQIFLGDEGIINGLLALVGLGPFPMLNTPFGTVVGYLTLTLPLVVVLQLFSLAAVDRSLVEAAWNLGCGRMRTIFTVIIPLAKIGLIIAATVLLHPLLRRLREPLLPRGQPAAHLEHPHHRHHQGRAAVATGGGGRVHDDRDPLRGRVHRGNPRLPEARVSERRAIAWFLRAYVAVVFAFVFAPIVASFVFSFNSDRFPTIPLGHFTLHWYETIFGDPDVWEAFGNSVLVSAVTSVLATFIGFCTAYTDFRYRFFGKGAYLGLALLPPTIPLVIMGLAMLALLSRIGMSGQLHSIIIAHVVLCSPFAMAIIRLRLAQMDPSLEAAAWNLGASEWRAMGAVILPFTRPAIVSALCLTAAVSFDEFAVAWFVSGLNKTVPVMILEILQGNVDPQINAIGTFVFVTSMTLVVIAQVLVMTREPRRA